MPRKRRSTDACEPLASCRSFGGVSTPLKLKAEQFPSLDDEVMYPRLPATKIEHLAAKGTRVAYAEGDVLVDQGTRDAPFIVLISGHVHVIEHKPGKEVWIAEADGGTFLGDIATFTGEPAVASMVAAAPTEAVVFDRSKLRAMMASWPEFAELVLRTLTARREWHAGNGYGVLRLIAARGSRRAFEVRDLLERNLLPVRWYDVEDEEGEAAKFLHWLDIPVEETPVLVRNESVLRNPSAAQVARELGLRAEVDGQRFDLVVLGGGPAGLAAAVYGGSEGLRTALVESLATGGQAGTSSRIENYLGFPDGVSGSQLTQRARMQAVKFGAELLTTRTVDAIEARGNARVVRFDDGSEVAAHSVVLATGVSYRSLDAPGLSDLAGRGVFYGAAATEAPACAAQDVYVVGGANSAGQAAMNFSRYAKRVVMLVRGPSLEASMSSYLIEQIAAVDHIEVRTCTEVVGAEGDEHLERLILRDRDTGTEETVDAQWLFVFIGAAPRTDWLDGTVARDARGFVLTGPDLPRRPAGWEPDRDPFHLETSVPGVFAVGDVRAESVKRVASAVGEGAMAVSLVHRWLENR
jgi:thioredoxin reductase (NADPH)